MKRVETTQDGMYWVIIDGGYSISKITEEEINNFYVIVKQDPELNWTFTLDYEDGITEFMFLERKRKMSEPQELFFDVLNDVELVEQLINDELDEQLENYLDEDSDEEYQPHIEVRSVIREYVTHQMKEEGIDEDIIEMVERGIDYIQRDKLGWEE